MLDVAILGGASFVAGVVDAMVGGGGLIQVPALFAVLPKEVPATLFGTSKLAGLFGSGTSAISYARRVRIAWTAVAPAAAAAFALSFAGAYTVTKVPSDFVRTLLPILLLFVAVYTFRNKNLGSVHAPLHTGAAERDVAVAVGAGIGFYAGFFGPGAGSFLIFMFVRFFGFDFVNASVAAKLVNLACNIAALLWLGYSGHILWQLGLVMAACQVAGSIVGTRIALKHGSGFVRKVFLIVVSLLILKTGYDAFLK